MLAASEPDPSEPALRADRLGSLLADSAAGNRAEKRVAGTYYSVLFLCADNSIGGALAEALLRRWGGEKFRAFSAAVNRRVEIHPLAAEFLRAQRLWHPALYSRNCRKFLAPDAPAMDFVISIGEQVPEGLPKAWPGLPEVIHWHISDPKLSDCPKEQTNSLRRTFVELENRIRLFVLVYEREAKKVARAAA
jgi:arsenate reductase (thioredoxin)